MGISLKTLVVMAVFCLLGQNTQGVPTKGRYMWVKCKPDSKNTNCVQKQGPWMDLPELSDRLPASAAKDLAKTTVELATDPTDGSGASDSFLETGSGDQWKLGGQDLRMFASEEGSTQLEEGSTSEVDYSEFVFPQNVALKKDLHHELMLQEEDLIL